MRNNTKLFYLLAVIALLSTSCQEKNKGEVQKTVESIQEEQAVKLEEATELVEEEVSEAPDEPLSVEDYITWNYPEHFIHAKIPSNVLPDIEEEWMVFLGHPKSYTVGIPPIYSIKKNLCIYVDDGKTKEHVVPGGSIGYQEHNLETILSYEPSYGPWLDFCYLPDIDGDGIQEPVIFYFSGIGSSMSIWKFQDGEFQIVKLEILSAPQEYVPDNVPDSE